MDKTLPLDYLVLNKISGFRCGVILPAQDVPMRFSELPGFFNISVPEDSIEPWKTASGSLHRVRERAVCGAIGEGIERYVGATTQFPLKKIDELNGQNKMLYDEFALFSCEQYSNSSFFWKKPDLNSTYFGEVYDILDNKKFWVPQELIGLGPRTGAAQVPSTSTGLAAHGNLSKAILSAIEEVLERDALAVYWINSLGGREIEMIDEYTKPIKERGGHVRCFDITQSWNPYRVVMVCGNLPISGKPRISMGVACRATYADAIEKAYCEWLQGVVFAGYYMDSHPDLRMGNIDDVDSFDKHAVYYSIYPEKWKHVPLIANAKKNNYQDDVKEIGRHFSPIEEIGYLSKKLKNESIRLYYRDITTADIASVGFAVARVISPDLSIIHGDERMPFLGGRTLDVAWRYGNEFARRSRVNIFPHPLG